MNRASIVFFAFMVCGFALHGQHRAIKGLVMESDSVTPLPFVYVINKTSGNGTMSDHTGRFSLISSDNDTLICSYIGYFKMFFPVSQLRPNAVGEVRLVMKRVPYDLQEVTISTFRYKPYEREYMDEIIDRSRMRTINAIQSPITALYMQFSREGRQVRKLAKIFEDLLIEEQVQKKLSKDILKKLTGDETIDYDAFRKYCYYVDNEYIITHDGAELYTKVMECYKRWKREMR